MKGNKANPAPGGTGQLKKENTMTKNYQTLQVEALQIGDWVSVKLQGIRAIGLVTAITPHDRLGQSLEITLGGQGVMTCPKDMLIDVARPSSHVK